MLSCQTIWVESLLVDCYLGTPENISGRLLKFGWIYYGVGRSRFRVRAG